MIFFDGIFRPYTSTENQQYLVFKKNVENIILSAHVRAENDMQKNSEKLTKTTDLGMLLLIKNIVFLGVF